MEKEEIEDNIQFDRKKILRWAKVLSTGLGLAGWIFALLLFFNISNIVGDIVEACNEKIMSCRAICPAAAANPDYQFPMVWLENISQNDKHKEAI